MQLQLKELVPGTKSPGVGMAVPRNRLGAERRERCRQTTTVEVSPGCAAT